MLHHPCSPIQPQRQMLLRPSPQLDPSCMPTMIWLHQPLVRAQSSPASTSLPPAPPTTIPSMSLSNIQLRFTTGETSFLHQQNGTQDTDTRWLPVCLCVCVSRPGLWCSNAEAPVFLWGQQPPPWACWEGPEHLVQTAGKRSQKPVWGVVYMHSDIRTNR